MTSSDPINSTYDFGSEFFNYTDYNATDIFNSSEFMKIPYSHDMPFENDLENGTGFINDVEELFPSTSRVDSDNIRMPRDVKRQERGTVMVICNNVGGFTSSRERWWYIAISNCRSNKGLDIRYRFRMTNGAFGDFWHEHFSADEMCKFDTFEYRWHLYNDVLLIFCKRQSHLSLTAMIKTDQFASCQFLGHSIQENNIFF